MMATAKKQAKQLESPTKKTKRASDSIAIIGRHPLPEAVVEEDDFLKGGLFNHDIIRISDYMSEKKIETSTVRDNLTSFLTRIGTIVANAPGTFGPYELHEIEISAELSLSGEFKLIGIGGTEVEAKGGLKFIIRRIKP